MRSTLRRLLPHWMRHRWQLLETFVAENRGMERERCQECGKTRVNRYI